MIDFPKLFAAPPEEVARLVSISGADIDHTLETHPELVGYAFATYEVARVATERAKWRLDNAKSVVHRRLMGPPHDLSATAADRQLDSMPEVQEATRQYHQQAYEAAVLKSLVSALEHRRDMIIQLSANRRKEKA